MTTRFVETSQALGMAVKFLQSHPLPFAMNITKGGKRSIQQNRLSFLWMREAADQLPEHDASGWRAFCKLEFAVPILCAENEDFKALYDAIVAPLPYETKLKCMVEPFDLPVTRQMNVKQNKRYLDMIYTYFTSRGVLLSDPDNPRFGSPEAAE